MSKDFVSQSLLQHSVSTIRITKMYIRSFPAPIIKNMICNNYGRTEFWFLMAKMIE